MDLNTIIQEADIRVVNAFSSAQKVNWLNEVNQEFFDVVKIPKTFTATTTGTSGDVTVSNDMREKNIRRVIVGSTYYRSMIYDTITASFNYYTLDEPTNKLQLKPVPATNRSLIVVYDRIPTTTFLSTDLTAQPEAPQEYHWLYILGLCVRIAKAMSDVSLANNYEMEFKNNLIVAQQNFNRGQIPAQAQGQGQG